MSDFEGSAESGSGAATERHLVEDIYAITALQQGMLVHSLGTPDSDAYVVQFDWTLRGALDRTAFLDAWNVVFARHPTLRSAFEWEGLPTPVQVVYRGARLTVVQRDWRDLSVERCSTDWEAYKREDRRRGLQLDRPPLHRLTLVQLPGERWRLLWTHYQAVIDGWSASVVQQEVAREYHARTSGGRAEPTEVRPYGSFIRWLRSLDSTAAERFWKATLHGVSAPTELLPRLAKRALAADVRSRSHRFDAERSRSLQQSLQAARLTLNSCVQGAWACVLSRRGGSADVVFGAVVSGRPSVLEGVESMVGFFINTIPVRCDVSAQQRVRSWLEQVQSDFMRARAFEHSALRDVQACSEVPRGQQLLATVVVFENYPADETGWGAELETLEFSATETVGFPIALYAGVIDRQLVLKLTWDPEQYGEQTAIWVLDELVNALERLPTRLDQPLAELFELPVDEGRWLSGCNETRATLPLDRSFCDLFEEQVDRTPRRIALRHRGIELSFAELDRRSNLAAQHLLERGVATGQVVALLAERSLDYVCALIAILKVGAAYLPLDPRAPRARIGQVVSSAAAALAICSEAMEQRLSGLVECHSLEVLLRPGKATARGVVPRPPRRTEPRALSYVIFTSGSTGQPKGAMVEQRGMVNHLFAKIRDLNLTAEDRIAQNASQTFDISVWQMLAGLLVGGQTHIYSDEVALDPARLLEAVAADEITVLETVPSLLRSLLQRTAGRNLRLDRLRWMIPTGEALPVQLAEDWLRRFPHVPLLNAYGPTECSDDVTHYAFSRVPPAERIPIGRPIVNTRMYVLDERLRLLPAGAIGELYVGGVGVGRGYIRDPRRTAVAFVPDPFSDEPGARLYKTGDLARYLPTGDLDFLGRADHQVKVRGFRIELGDIEAALLEHDRVEQCVVVHRPGVEGTALVAYFVARGQLGHGELREHLLARLPDYMVPQFSMQLERLPLNANGKLDLRALPEPHGQPGTTHPLEAPTGPTERLVADLWRTVLQVDHVGRNDNFFDLGGHSLLLLRVLDGLEPHYPRTEILDLFQYPVIRALAQFLDDAQPARQRPDGARAVGRREALGRQRRRRGRG